MFVILSRCVVQTNQFCDFQQHRILGFSCHVYDICFWYIAATTTNTSNNKKMTVERIVEKVIPHADRLNAVVAVAAAA